MTLQVTHDFSAGTTIASSEVNQNFTDVEDYVNDLEAGLNPDTTGVWKMMWTAGGRIATGAAASADYWLSDDANLNMETDLFSPGAGDAFASRVPIWYLNDADREVAGMTLQYRVVVTYVSEGNFSETFTVSLRAVTSAVPSAITGGVRYGTVTNATLATGLAHNEGAAFAHPADGYYALEFKTSGNVASGADLAVKAAVQFRHV